MVANAILSVELECDLNMWSFSIIYIYTGIIGYLLDLVGNKNNNTWSSGEFQIIFGLERMLRCLYNSMWGRYYLYYWLYKYHYRSLVNNQLNELGCDWAIYTILSVAGLKRCVNVHLLN